MKSPKTSSSSRSSVVVDGALLAATAIVTVLGMAVVIPASSIVKPVYAQIAADINEQVTEEDIPELALGGNAEQDMLQLDFGQNVEEVVEEETTGQPLPVMP
jgi:hypothetical protein